MGREREERRGLREKGQTEEEEGKGRIKKGRGKRRGKERKEGEERGSHKFNKVSSLHCLQQLLWPRGEVGNDCTQVVMATAKPHTLTLNRTSTTLPGGAREEGGRRE